MGKKNSSGSGLKMQGLASRPSYRDKKMALAHSFESFGKEFEIWCPED